MPEPVGPVRFGIDPRELSDEDLLRELEHLHATRHETLLHGSADALRRHTTRMVELEDEYVRRHQERDVDPGRTREGARPGRPNLKEGASMTRPVEGEHKYAQEIRSPDEHEEHPGKTLVTTNHEVIRRWAEERGARPATVPGTEHGGRPGVLRFDFPGYEGENLKEISWDEWFKTFDERKLNFIYQEHTADGRQSNFFRLESPERQDA